MVIPELDDYEPEIELPRKHSISDSLSEDYISQQYLQSKNDSLPRASSTARSGLMNHRIDDDSRFDEDGNAIGTKGKGDSEDSDEEGAYFGDSEDKELISNQGISKSLAVMNICFALLLIIPTIIAAPDMNYEIISLYIVSILMLIVSIFALFWHFMAFMEFDDFKFQVNELANEKVRRRRSEEIRKVYEEYGEDNIYSEEGYGGDPPEEWMDFPPQWVLNAIEDEHQPFYGDIRNRIRSSMIEKENIKKASARSSGNSAFSPSAGSRTSVVIRDGEEIIEDEDSYETSDIHSSSSDDESMGAFDPDGEDEEGLDSPPPFQAEGASVEMTRMPRKSISEEAMD